MLAFLIFNLTFVKEGHAALSFNDQATGYSLFNFLVLAMKKLNLEALHFNNDGTKMFTLYQWRGW